MNQHSWRGANYELQEKAKQIFASSRFTPGFQMPTHCLDCGLSVEELRKLRGIKHFPINGHHEDYAKPLDVIWVCQHCHEVRHLIGGWPGATKKPSNEPSQVPCAN